MSLATWIVNLIRGRCSCGQVLQWWAYSGATFFSFALTGTHLPGPSQPAYCIPSLPVLYPGSQGQRQPSPEQLACGWVLRAFPAFRGVAKQMQNLPCRKRPLRHKGLGSRKLPVGFQTEAPVSPSLSQQPCFGEMLTFVQRLGSYYLVSLLDFILMFKTPLAGGEVSGRIQASNLPENPKKESAQQ